MLLQADSMSRNALVYAFRAARHASFEAAAYSTVSTCTRAVAAAQPARSPLAALLGNAPAAVIPRFSQSTGSAAFAGTYRWRTGGGACLWCHDAMCSIHADECMITCTQPVLIFVGKTVANKPSACGHALNLDLDLIAMCVWQRMCNHCHADTHTHSPSLKCTPALPLMHNNCCRHL